MFPNVGSTSICPFIIPRFSEIDFQQAVENLGGRKIPEDVVKTPDFEIGDTILELKDLQTESLFNRDRQLTVARLCADIKENVIDLNLLMEDGFLGREYQKLVANSVKNHIKKASRQAKSYALLRAIDAVGIIILNTGMFSVQHETLKKIVENELKHNTDRISFSLLFTQQMQNNGLDLYATYHCEFIGKWAASLEGLRDEVLKLVEEKMKQVFVGLSSNNGVESIRPISFLADNKVFYWNPGQITGSLTQAFESRRQGSQENEG